MTLEYDPRTFVDPVTVLDPTEDAHPVTRQYLDPLINPGATQAAFTINVSGGGTDPGYELRITSQAEATAWGDFLTVGAAIASLYGLLLDHLVTIQLPTGTWNLAAGELDQIWRLTPTINGWVRIAGDPGWTQLATTSQEAAVSSADNGDVVLAADPFAAVDAKGYYLYIVSGTGAAQYKPIRTHSGVNVAIGGTYSPALTGTSIVRVAEPATTLKFGEDTPGFRSNPETLLAPTIEFWHLTIETATANKWIRSNNISMQFDGGLRFNDTGIFCFFAMLNFGDVVFDVRNYAWTAIDVRSGSVSAFGTSKVLYLLGSVAAPAIVQFASSKSLAIFGGGVSLLVENALTVDGWTGPYLQSGGRNTYLTVYTRNVNFLRSDQGGSAAVELRDGASLWVESLTDLLGSTFKGGVDVIMDGANVSWDEIDADPTRSMISHVGSTVVEA